MTSDRAKKPHEALTGIDIQGGWMVRDQIRKTDNATGGHFSCGYVIEHADGRRGYLKALDFFSMLPESVDPARDLEPLIRAFNFERDLLETCRKNRLSHIVSALDSGAVTVSGFAPPATVQYIILELADGDVRKLMAINDEFDLAFALRTLHQIAVGLKQLHGIGVAHQDLKPSNVSFSTDFNLPRLETSAELPFAVRSHLITPYIRLATTVTLHQKLFTTALSALGKRGAWVVTFTTWAA